LITLLRTRFEVGKIAARNELFHHEGLCAPVWHILHRFLKSFKCRQINALSKNRNGHRLTRLNPDWAVLCNAYLARNSSKIVSLTPVVLCLSNKVAFHQSLVHFQQSICRLEQSVIATTAITQTNLSSSLLRLANNSSIASLTYLGDGGCYFKMLPFLPPFACIAAKILLFSPLQLAFSRYYDLTAPLTPSHSDHTAADILASILTLNFVGYAKL
jgi:hypothetical protein